MVDGGCADTVYLLCWMALIVSVSGEFSGKVNCFTCRDKDRCTNVEVIYGIDDSTLYEKRSNNSLPACSEISQLTSNKTCIMCHHENNITIVCSDDVTRPDVEDSDGYVKTHQTDCVPLSSGVPLSSFGHGQYKLMAAVGIYSVLLPCFLSCWQF